ncbi:MAG: PEP/pyruvate-binding domain-containing protein, partial [Thermoanaerobaculia bacterium]|nr:PEP/pyruvate-binding domain-containing protein [Thermoanaerobaculia bacterium]
GSAAERLERLSAALAAVGEGIGAAGDGSARLALLDLSVALERETVRAAFERLTEPLTRADLLRTALQLTDAAFGVGLLSSGERAALSERLTPLLVTDEAASADYLAAVRALRRSAPWALATVRYTFGEALVRYVALEPLAARFADELLRGSPVLPLAEATTRLAADADAISGISHRLFGRSYGGLLALNPGVARGPLRVVEPEAAETAALSREEIVVLPLTVSDLDPVAGILSLGEGNLLSHVQLLARNLGIPNATVSPVAAPALAAGAGRAVLLAVGTDGSIVLEEWDALPAEVRERIAGAQREPRAGAGPLLAPTPDLGVVRPLGLEELRATLAGRVVGPKAANLGELAALFPGRVEQAVALPFGIFAAHVGGGREAPKGRIERAFAEHRAGRLDEVALAAELASVRAAIAATPLSAELRSRLERELGERFGPAGSYGVFVRSDTNVEDLPGFTGAGLNETVPNVVGLEPLWAAVSRVWASVLSPRAVAWRSTILANPEEIYSSVLLMKSVPATKSGVLVTADLVERGEGLTVATAWGVGGAVDGEAAETLVLRPDGDVRLIGEAKAPYQRRLASKGGVEWIPAPKGPVLTPAERRALVELAAEVEARRAPAVGA